MADAGSRAVSIVVRQAHDAKDFAQAARLLVAFNGEYGDPAPPTADLTAHLTRLGAHDASVLLAEVPAAGVPAAGAQAVGVPAAGAPAVEVRAAGVPAPGVRAVGVAVLRFRTQTWEPALEAYLAEFYVVPERRGEGIGSRFLDAVIVHARDRGATYLDLNTSEDDEAARHVYESRGFDNHEGRGHGPRALYYELEL